MDCLDENSVLDFLDGALSEDVLRDVHSHLDSCASCQQLVGAVGRPDAAPTLVRGQSLDRYLILEPRGVGGMGVVYAAYDPQLDRKVALKLLRPEVAGLSPATGRARLLSEAQALAKLSHPNVVTVYEAKALGEQLFVAMEFVDGENLRAWLRQSRPWDEVVERFVQAGRGLWAAHQAALVHRDFKPENVLLRNDGRVQVTDFGLAHVVGSHAEAPDKELGDAEDVAITRFTRTGAILGTPAYMAPEQWRGEAVDARSDQFSFCVALYEALYAERPFPGRTVRELKKSIQRGVVGEPPRKTHVPGWLRKVLLRGLSASPMDRYPTMEQLLRALEPKPRTTWAVRGVAVASALCLVAAVALNVRRNDPRAQLCKGGERKLAGIWDEAKKNEVRDALLASGSPYAAAAWQGVERTLDAYTQRWLRMHAEACEATRLFGEQSEALLDLRVTCLERRLRDVGALTDLFVRTRGQTAEHAIQASYALPALKECEETDALESQTRLPDDPVSRSRVEKVHAQLSEVRALVSAGKYVTALEKAEATAALAREVNHLPTRAEALYQLGVLQMKHGDAKPAEAALLETSWAAVGGRHDRLAARARIDLVFVIGELEARQDAVDATVREAEAALARFGHDADLESSLESAEGGVLTAQDRCEQALPHLRRALELADQAYAPDDPNRARILNNLGNTLRCVGDLEGARQNHELALALRERTFGADHPEVAVSLSNLANVYFSREEFGKALPLHQRALAIREAAMGPHSSTVAAASMNVGVDLISLGRNAEGRQYVQRALDVFEETLGKDSPRLALPLSVLGHVDVELGDPNLARASLERAIKLLDGRDDEQMAIARFNLARALRSARKGDGRAQKLAVQAREYFERRKDANRSELKEINTWLGTPGPQTRANAVDHGREHT